MRVPKHHPRIYPANNPLLDRYDTGHPAVRALQIHAEACDLCVGREIAWPESKDPPIEQVWFSAARRKQQLFSSFAYEFLSYSLVLDGWLELSAVPTAGERRFLDRDEPLMRALLEECRLAATAEGNTHVLPLIQKALDFVDAYKAALLSRFRECAIPAHMLTVPRNGSNERE